MTYMMLAHLLLNIRGLKRIVSVDEFSTKFQFICILLFCCGVFGLVIGEWKYGVWLFREAVLLSLTAFLFLFFSFGYMFESILLALFFF